MSRLDWRDFGADPSGTMDSTQAINDCFQTAIETGMEAYGPKGIYKTTDTLVWNDDRSRPRISGAGAETVIQPDGNDYDWLVVGNGDATATDAPAGWVRDLWIQGGNQVHAPSGVTAGLKLNGARFVDVRNVYVAFAPIGFDMVNNNFGSSFTNCRTLFDFCRIGVALRGHNGSTFGSGNDIPFYNCWFHGREAGVWMEGQGGGYHFHGGQLAAGVGAADSDARGAVTVGAAIETGLPMGSCDATFVGVSFESIVNGWNVRGIGSGTNPNGLRLRFYGCSFFGGTSAADNAHGVLKIAGGYDDVVIFNGCAVNRVYTGLTPVSMGTSQTSNARPYYEETGTFGNPTFGAGGGTPTSPRMLNTPMFELSQVIRGRMDKGFVTMFNGMMLRNRTGGFLEFSTDWGATWQRVSTTPAPA